MDFLRKLGIEGVNSGTSTGTKHMESKSLISSFTPVDGKKIANVTLTSKDQYEQVIATAQNAHLVWR